jgi:hypothetical protein
MPAKSSSGSSEPVWGSVPPPLELLFWLLCAELEPVLAFWPEALVLLDAAPVLVVGVVAFCSLVAELLEGIVELAGAAFSSGFVVVVGVVVWSGVVVVAGVAFWSGLVVVDGVVVWSGVVVVVLFWSGVVVVAGGVVWSGFVVVAGVWSGEVVVDCPGVVAGVVVWSGVVVPCVAVGVVVFVLVPVLLLDVLCAAATPSASVSTSELSHALFI